MSMRGGLVYGIFGGRVQHPFLMQFYMVQATFPHEGHRMLNKALPGTTSSYISPCALQVRSNNLKSPDHMEHLGWRRMQASQAPMEARALPMVMRGRTVDVSLQQKAGSAPLQMVPPEADLVLLEFTFNDAERASTAQSADDPTRCAQLAGWQTVRACLVQACGRKCQDTCLLLSRAGNGFSRGT